MEKSNETPDTQNSCQEKQSSYWSNFMRQEKGSRVAVFGDGGYIRPNIINMPEDE